jgi:hypothetical protein
MIFKSHNELHSYGPEKLIYGHFWHLNSKCDLDLGDIDVILSHNTPSNDGEMFQLILKSQKNNTVIARTRWNSLRDTPSNDG